ncbi:helix-turn-helix transcriptional regulator [Gordonibacter sp. 28C]|uniref:LuxR C-terminal-related transcriptional regulator n=1 Tax=Gordonibacter sp. 28C TaxID=2078569 RepID=UPI000DF852FE|nr:LuxR C-terminal-related transcriptional regulator [Gordonibacter sp. 28C]RDB64593.1 helix-turn-helix transcriptional regulator [Gordonibacter sp. 28C]
MGEKFHAADGGAGESNPGVQPELLLSDKFAPASLPDVCAPRLRVVDAINRAARSRFVYIGAPAGSGKTVSTLLWVRKAKQPTVWIGLDRYDDVPSVFYRQLATGLYSVQPDNEAMRGVLVDPVFSASPVEHVISLVAEMLPPDKRHVLVFDDVHLISNREIIKSLPAVLKRLPGAFTVVLLSRVELPEEWRAVGVAGGPAVLDVEDLRFAEDEIGWYFDTLGLPLTPDETRIVYAATDGWAIGVTALAKSGHVNAGSSRFLFESYFDERVWSTWDDDLRAFCLATSVAGEFDSELAAVLSGRDDAGEVMDRLARTNTFLTRLHGDTFRYHHLFRDYLIRKTEDSNVDRVALCKRAAEHFRQKRDYMRALRFWLESGDFSGMDTYLLLFLFESNPGSVADYADFLRTLDIEKIPDDAYRVCPPLHILALWYAYLTGRCEMFEHHMDELYRALPRIALFDSRFVESSILSYSIDHRTSVLDKARKFSKFSRFVKHFTPKGLATTLTSFTHNLPYPHRSNLDYSCIALEEGGMDLLGRTFSVLLGAEWGYIYPLIPACFAYERDDMETALAGIEEAQRAVVPENRDDGRICIAVMHHAALWQQGRDDEAAAELAAFRTFVEAKAPYFLPNLKAYEAKLALFDADAKAARAWLDEYFVTEVDRIELVRAFQHFTTARAFLALGQADDADRLLDDLLEFGRAFNRPLDCGEAGALKASLLWAAGRKGEAVDVLATALEELAPYGFYRVVADEGAAVEPVLKSLVARMVRADYEGPLERVFVQEALLAAHERAGRFRGVTANLGASDKPVKLSRQQKLVLELLAQGLRAPEIAERTELSVPTVKSHLAAAYRKLDAHTAEDAVLHARKRGLIG